MTIQPNLVNKILELNIASPNLNRYLKNHYPIIYKRICEYTNFLNAYYPTKVSILARLYVIKNNINEYPMCKICKKPVRFISIDKGFAKWCSISCSCNDSETQLKLKQTKLERYGNSSYNNKEKTKLTIAKKLEENPNYYKDITDKCKATKFKNYGNENFVNIDKCKSTKLERYGNSNYNNIDKNLQTKEERYGYKHYNNREKFKQTISTFSVDDKNRINQKRKLTNLEKYGVESYTQTSECREKTKQTNLERYGVTCVLLLDECKAAALDVNIEKTWKLMSNHQLYNPLFTLDEYKKHRTELYEYKWQCKNCGHIFYAQWKDGNVRKRCPICEPKLHMIAQTELYKFISDNYKGQIITNTKHIISPLELDFYLPDINLAIEYNGIYWHSADRKPKRYHLDKTEMCENKGIKLIHIFEDEWLLKNDIVKNRIANVLGNFSKNIYARKCIVKEVSGKDSKEFQDLYHIQGSVKSPINFGLYYDNELIALMTFSKPRFNKKYEYELIRYCTKSTYHVIGGAGKLLKHFERTINPKSLISYADRRWSNGNLYRQLGFIEIEKSPINYWYFCNGTPNRESRIKFQKHKLKTLFPNTFDNSLTEFENMKLAGYTRIYDCGNLVFTKIY